MSRKQNSPLTASLVAKQNSPLMSFVAGAVGGSIDACFTMPFDAVKTQIQRDPRMGALGVRCVTAGQELLAANRALRPEFFATTAFSMRNSTQS